MVSTTTDRINGVNGGVAMKAPCRAATTANITLSGEQTIDGIALVANDRVLVKDQTTASENGIYLVSTSGWTRALDFDGNRDVVSGTLVFVLLGTVNAASFWRVSTTGSITIGTTSLAFAISNNQLAGVSAYMLTVLDDANAAAALATLNAETRAEDLTAATAASGDYVIISDVSDSGNSKKALVSDIVTLAIPSTTIDNSIQDFRLTLTTGVPVTTTDVTGATTLYCTPYKGNRIALYDGSAWNVRTSAQFSLALGTLTSGKPYDVFCYDNAGVPTLEFTVWTDDTTRATALAYQDGILVKSGTATRRYLGTFYTTSTTTTEDSVANRYLWNYYNRIARAMRRLESTASWTYTTATWRQARASTSNQLNFVTGASEDCITARVCVSAGNGGGANVDMGVAVGVDSTTTPSPLCIMGGSQSASGAAPGTGIHADYSDYLSAGKHSLMWLEISKADGTTTWYANGGTSFTNTGGITGTILA